jgi:uncharacterized protein YjbI with pentapeptide repeats
VLLLSGAISVALGLPLVVIGASTGMAGSVMMSTGAAALIASVTLSASSRQSQAERKERRNQESKTLAVRVLSERDHRGQHFGGTYLAHSVDVSRHDFREAIFEGAYWEDATFEDANFEKARFDDARLFNCSGSGANFQNARFAGARVSGLYSKANFRGSECQYANMQSAFLDNSTFASLPGNTTYLRGTDFSGSGGLDRVDFSRCECEEANFSRAKLFGPCFQDAFLAEARFDRATICANFQGAMFSGQRGDRPASFEEAEILDIFAPSANFSDAWIFNVDLSTVKNLGRATFQGALASAGTKFPSNFDPAAQGVLMLHDMPNDEAVNAVIEWEDRYGRPAGWVS